MKWQNSSARRAVGVQKFSNKVSFSFSLLIVNLFMLGLAGAQIPLPAQPTAAQNNPNFQITAGDRSSPGIPLSARLGLSSPTHGVPLPPHAAATPGGSGVPLSASTTGAGFSASGGFGTSHTGVPLPPPSSTAGGVTSFGVPLKPGSTTRFTTLGVSGPVMGGNIGRGIQETKPQGNFAGSPTAGGINSFHINELPTSIELDKNLSPVPPYFVFSDDDSREGSLTIGGPKTGGLLPIANPTSDPKLLRLLSQPTVRQRLVAEARADKALKITSILMAHKQVVGGQISYASLRVAETNCPASRINSLRGCEVQPTSDTYVCEVAFWERPWLNVTRMLDEKTACAETEDDAEFDSEPPREIGGLRGVIEGDEVGGVWAQISSLPAGLSQQQLAIEAFNYVDAHSDSNFRGYLAGHKIHSVLVDRARNLTKVQVWVDYGFTMCLKLDWTKGGQKDPRNCPVDSTRSQYSCALSLLYHPSQLMPLRVVHGDKDELTCTKKPLLRGAAASGAAPATLSTSTVVGGGRSASPKDLQGCPGCPVQAALSDPAILSMLDFAMQEYDRLYSDDSNIHRPVSLMTAYTQATAGTKYVLTVEVAETICRKGVPGQNRKTCPADPSEETDVCIFIVLHQPWLPSSHLLSAKCFDKNEAHKYTHQHQQAILLATNRANSQTGGLNAGGSVSGHSGAVGVALPAANNLKPLSLSFGASSTSRSSAGAPALDAKTQQIVQFVVDQINLRELADDQDSRGRDDSREFDDDSRESREHFGSFRGHGGDSDGYYQLVKVHRVTPLNGGSQVRMVLELGETNCSKGIVARQSTRHCTLDPFEEHEVCDAIVVIPAGRSVSPRLTAISCEDLGDYLGESSLVPPVPSVTWMPAPFLPVGAMGRPQTATGFSASLPAEYRNMATASTTDPMVRKAGELVVARYNLLSGEDDLALLQGVLTAHTQTTPSGSSQYLLEVEMAETRCKKYLPIIDQSKCPIDPSEEKIVCQAEVEKEITHGHRTQQQTAWDGLSLKKLYCREKEEYIITRSTGQEGPWTPLALNDPRIKRLATLTADQYDLRSDDEDLYIVHKVVSAKLQNVSGFRYDIVVELAETVCPKYKEHINKNRCKIDPTEEIKVCNARLFEPASGSAGLHVTKLQCRDKSDHLHSPSRGLGSSLHSHESSEILVLPSVHPSAHARPVFLKKFNKPTFRVRYDDSGESRESNEFSRSGTARNNSHRRIAGLNSPSTGRSRSRPRFISKESDESNEQFYKNPRAPGTTSRRFDSRSEEDDSDEFLPRGSRIHNIRGKRSLATILARRLA